MAHQIGIPGVIKRITPGASYQGTTYDQTVEVVLPDGTEIDIFDKTVPIASENVVGDSRKLIVLALTNSRLKKISERRGIAAERDRTEYTIFGEVIDLSIGDRWHPEKHRYQDLLLVDVGTGTVLVERNRRLRELIESNEIGAGDYIEVSVIRFDLLEID